MGTYTKRFYSIDEYERWLDRNGEQIHVVSIRNSADSHHISLSKPSVAVQYRTANRALAPLKRMHFSMLSLAAIAAIFLVMFIYTFSKVSTVAQVQPLKLDAHYRVIH